MGRKPNPVIMEFFQRGPKLGDSSNRYSHNCKACGENFPKGRLDSLTNHLTKRCPAISEADRINACLNLHGISHAAQRNQRSQHARTSGPAVDLPAISRDAVNQLQRDDVNQPQPDAVNQSPRDWTALETLAEVSRQIDLSEKHDDRDQNMRSAQPPVAISSSVEHTQERLEVRDNDSKDTALLNTGSSPTTGNKGAQSSPTAPNRVPTTEEKLRTLLPKVESLNETSNLTMAAVATARVNRSLLDPQLLGEVVAAASAVSAPAVDLGSGTEIQPAAPSAQPWGEITNSVDSQQARGAGTDPAQEPSRIARGGFRMETGSGQNGTRSRHSRARFDATRRKEVQEVREIGACIRCRILRKTCSKGSPCDACRKVLSPRIWRSGCVRTKFTEQLSLYSAGVQIVLAQHRINSLKATMELVNKGIVIETTHFPETGVFISLQALERVDAAGSGADADASVEPPTGSSTRVVMIDNAPELPASLEAYTKDILPELVRRETSHFMKVTLETAFHIVEETNDELLKKAIELWGLIEVLDRERQWNIAVKTASEISATTWIREDTDQDTFTTICLQLTAAAERKASNTSRVLLTGMQRILQDSKSKVDFSMFFATLILLNCVEKSTWAFTAWEQDNLRPLWPLEKEPSNFTQQGYVVADLFRILLGIRKALPRTSRQASDGMLVTEEEDIRVRNYFQAVALDVDTVRSKRENPVFSPTDPRSFELLFCSTLLLPTVDG